MISALLGFGFTILMSNPSQAFPPNSNPLGMSKDSNPTESFMGEISNGVGMYDILTVPSDKIFILTSIQTPAAVCFYENSTKIFCQSNNSNSTEGVGNNPFRFAHGVLKIDSGATLKVDNDYYYVEGYYAEPTGWPNEFFYGTISPGQSQNLLTIPSDKDFIITGVATASGQSGQQLCLYENGNRILRAYFFAAAMSETNFLVMGKSRLRVSAGSTLSIQHDGSSSYLDAPYYIQGYYAEP
jgi:hypothetical protein